jgi:hypothetical protein
MNGIETCGCVYTRSLVSSPLAVESITKEEYLSLFHVIPEGGAQEGGWKDMRVRRRRQVSVSNRLEY